MNTKSARLLILVLIIFFSLLSSNAKAEDYYSGNPYSPEPSHSGNQGVDVGSSANFAIISQSSFIPNNNSTVISSFSFSAFSQPAAAYNAPNSYNNSPVISSFNSQPEKVYSPLNNYNNPMTMGPYSYSTPSQSSGAYNDPNRYSYSPVVSSYSYSAPSQSGEVYNTPNSYNNPTVISPCSYSAFSQPDYVFMEDLYPEKSYDPEVAQEVTPQPIIQIGSAKDINMSDPAAASYNSVTSINQNDQSNVVIPQVEVPKIKVE